MQLTLVVFLAALTGCRQVLGIEDPTVVASDARPIDAEAIDAEAIDADAVDAAPVDAAILGPWGTPMRVFVEVAPLDDDPSLTGDMLELYLDRNGTIYVSKRTSPSAPWPAPTLVIELDDPGTSEGTPKVSLDGRTIVFSSNRTPTLGGFDVWQATRGARRDAWSTPAKIAALSSPMDDVFGGVSDDGLIAVLARRPAGGGNFGLYRSTRGSTSMGWPSPTPISALNVGPGDKSPNIVGPGQTLYFDSNRDGDFDIYVAELVGGDYAGAMQAPGLASAAIDEDPWVSPDQRTIYFSSARDGGMSQLFWSTR